MLADVTNVLWLSVLLQIAAAVLALRLIPVTGRTIAWVLLSFAFMLMASRRAISLLYQQGTIESAWWTAMMTESVALGISILILGSTILLKGVFLKQRRDEDELHKLTQVVDESSSSMIITDLQGRIEYVNRRFSEVSGYLQDEVKGQAASILDAGMADPATVKVLWKTLLSGRAWEGELCSRTKVGGQFWVNTRISPVRDVAGKPRHYVAVLEDISEQKAQQLAIEHMAMHDALTDLPNRALFHERLKRAIQQTGSKASSHAVLLIDLNHFKVINDTLGHHIGDRVLKEVARRIHRSIKSNDTAARMGGDEFLLLLEGVTDNQALSIADRLVPVIGEKMLVDGHQFEVGMSIGVAMYPHDGEDPDTLVQKADIAMYSSKKTNACVTMYDSHLDEYSVVRLDLLSELSEAIDQEQFVLHYQPRIKLEDNTIESVEALVRWEHPRHGIMMPDRFIPLLEESGGITQLTRLVMRKTLTQLQAWRCFVPEFTASINISTRDLCDRELAADLATMLQQHSLDMDSVVLEITESSLMEYTQYTFETLRALEKMGVKLAIDDYGTGYSSLSYLKELPVSELKIDKSFIMNMLQDENDEVIVRSTIDLGHKLGLDVIAEGVEEAGVSQLLQNFNCRYAQGFYFSKPVPADKITEYLRNGSLLTVAGS